MPIFGIRRKPSFSRMSKLLSSSTDPLAFLQAGRSAGSGEGRDAFNQILASFRDVVADVERAIQSIIEKLRHERNIDDRIAVGANSDVRAEMARARTLAEAKRNELQAEISFRLHAMFLQNLIMFPDQDTPVRRWSSMSGLVERRDMPVVSEPALSNTDGNPKVRRKRLNRWWKETDEWLAVLCLNHADEVIAKLVEEIGSYSSAWTDTVNQLRRESTTGGRLSRELNVPEYWTFNNDDPTVKNLVSGAQAQEMAGRILDSVQLSNADLTDICQAVYDALNGKPIYRSERIDILELEKILAEAIAGKLKDAVALDDDFLSLISNGRSRAEEELSDLLVEMRMGAAAMEDKLWGVGEYRMGHVNSAAGVGLTTSALRETVLRGLGSGRRFAAVEAHPSDKHRIEVQISTVGASLSDLSIFREMVNAWYSWHFEENWGEDGNVNARVDAVRKNSWKLYPDIGQNSGVRPAVIELIDDDLRQVWDTPGDVALRLAYGHLEDSDTEVLYTINNTRPKLTG